MAIASSNLVRPSRLVITTSWGDRLGGAENLLWTLLQNLDRNRIEPFMVFFQDGVFVREVAGLGLSTRVYPAGRLRQPRQALGVIRSLASALVEIKPDLILNWSAKAHLYSASAAMLAGIRGRNLWWQQSVPNGHWLDRVATLLPTRGIGCYSALSEKAQARHFPSRHTFVMQPGIDEPIQAQRDEVAALRASIGIPVSRTVAGTVGRLQAHKGQDRFLRSIAQLRRGGYDVHGLVVGHNAGNFSPEYEPYLHALARELNLEGYVTFTGWVPNVAPYLQMMDVFVHAAPAEPFGLVLLEAMALGIPVVAFNAGGPAEIIESEKSGLLVPSGDDAELTAAIERLLSDSSARSEIGHGGLNRYQEHFSVQKMTDRFENAILQFCGY